MENRIIAALEMSLSSQTIMEATQDLEELRIMPNFTTEAIPLLTSNLSLPAMIQIALSNRNFKDREPQPYVQIAQSLINLSNRIPQETIAKMSDFLSKLVSHLFQGGWYTAISELSDKVVQQQNIICLNCISECFSAYKHVPLNDEIATKLLQLIQDSQPAIQYAIVNYQPQYSQVLLILEAAYTWEDLPDFYRDNYVVILELLKRLIVQAKPEEFSTITGIIIEAISNHQDELQQYVQQSVEFLISSAELAIGQQNYEVSEAKLLQRIANFVASPEYQQVMLGYVQQLSAIAFKGLETTQEDLDAIQYCDNQYLQCYQSRFDFNSRKEGSEQILKELCRAFAGFTQQVQNSAIQELNPQNLARQVSLFRVISIQTQSKMFGLRLSIDESVVQQFAELLYKQTLLVKDLDLPLNSLNASTILKFAVDFSQFISEELLEQLINVLLGLYYASSNKFYCKNIAFIVEASLQSQNPIQLFVSEKILNKLLAESQVDVNSELEISAVCSILKLVVNSLNEQSQQQFMNNLLQLLQFAISKQAAQSYLYYLFETIGCFIKFCKFDSSLIFYKLIELTKSVGEQQLLEISPFIYQLFVLCQNVNIAIPVFYESLTFENYQYYPDMAPAFLLFACRFLERNEQFKTYQRPAQLLKLTDQYDHQTQAAADVLQYLLPQLINMPTKAHMALKFLNDIRAVQGFRLQDEFYRQVVEYLMGNKQYIFTNRQYLKHAAVFLLDNAQFCENTQDLFSSIVKPAASAFGIRDQYKERYCQQIILLCQQNAAVVEFARSAIGMVLGKIRTRGGYNQYSNEKDLSINGISLLECCEEDIQVMKLSDLTTYCEQSLGIEKWE